MDLSEAKYLPKVDHTPAELDAASRLLLRAAAAMEEHGHVKNDLGAPGRGFCLIGALVYAAHGQMKTPEFKGHEDYYDAHGRMCQSVSNFIGWNNAPERTAAEVIAKLRAVALGL